MGRRTEARRIALAAALAALLGGCGETVIKHGHQFQESDLKQLNPGMSQEQVKTVLGTPTTTARAPIHMRTFV